MNKTLIFSLFCFVALVVPILAQERGGRIRKHRAHKSNETWHLQANISTSLGSEENSTTPNPTDNLEVTDIDTSLDFETTQKYESDISSETSNILETSKNFEALSDSVPTTNSDLETTMDMNAMFNDDTTISSRIYENEENLDEVYEVSGNNSENDDVRKNEKNQAIENGNFETSESTSYTEIEKNFISTEEPSFASTMSIEDQRILQVSEDDFDYEENSIESSTEQLINIF